MNSKFFPYRFHPKYILLCLIYCCLSISKIKAEDDFPLGKFSKDSVKVGEPVKYILSFIHSPSLELVFPDTNYNYYPFELINKKYFPTTYKENKVLDSVIFELRTFQIESKQYLKLPVYLINQDSGDSTALFPEIDSVILKEYITHVPSTINFMDNTSFVKVPKQINYPYYLLAFFGIVVSFLLIVLLFKKVIVKRYKLYILRKTHLSFVKNFEKLQREFYLGKEIGSLENAVSLWKVYLSKIENKAINTYTTTEIITLFNNENLKEGLQIIDGAIYGGQIKQEPEKALDILKKFTNQRFIKLRKKIRNV